MCQHIIVSTNVPTCASCKKTFSSKNCLSRHIKTKVCTKNTQFTIKCSYCPKICHITSSLFHQFMNHSNVEDFNICVEEKSISISDLPKEFDDDPTILTLLENISSKNKLENVIDFVKTLKSTKLKQDKFEEIFKTNFKLGINSLRNGKIFEEISKDLEHDDNLYTGCSTRGFERFKGHSFAKGCTLKDVKLIKVSTDNFILSMIMEQTGDLFLRRKGFENLNKQSHAFEWGTGKSIIEGRNFSLSTPTFFYILQKKQKQNQTATTTATTTTTTKKRKKTQNNTNIKAKRLKMN
jgi:hypothetical protein